MCTFFFSWYRSWLLPLLLKSCQDNRVDPRPSSPVSRFLCVYMAHDEKTTNRNGAWGLPSSRENMKQRTRYIAAATTVSSTIIDTSRNWRFPHVDPFRTAVPFWGRTTQILSSFSPKTGPRSYKYKGEFTPVSASLVAHSCVCSSTPVLREHVGKKL